MNTYTTYIFDQEVTIEYSGTWVEDYAHNVPSHYEVYNTCIMKDGETLDLSDELIDMAEKAVMAYEDAERVYEGAA